MGEVRSGELHDVSVSSFSEHVGDGAERLEANIQTDPFTQPTRPYPSTHVLHSFR